MNLKITPLALWLALLAPTCLFAQATMPVPAPVAEKAIELSPFIVMGEQETGYAATATLSGSRLRTDLRDVAASVTVLTNEFLDDLGVTDLASALEFAVGAENDATSDPTGLNSLNQGFVGSDFGDTNQRSGEVRFRGLGRATTTTNFIQTAGSTDRYNSESGEVLRGANSILFGLAEPAGLVSYRTKMANLQRDRLTFDTKIDNFGSRRGVLDAGNVIVKDKLALRVVTLYSDTRYKVDQAFEDDRRLYLTTTVKPFPHTILRAYHETVDVKGRRPNYRSVQDNVTDWLALYGQYARLLTPTQLAAAFYHDPFANPNTPAVTTFTLADGSTVNLGTLRRGLDAAPNRTALAFDNRDWNNPMLGGAFILGGRTITGGNPAVPLRGTFARSANPGENRTGFTDPRVLDTRSFPFLTQEMTALPGNDRFEQDQKFNVTLDQRILPDFYVSATYQRETWTQEYFVSPIAQTQQLSFDINTRLPDGRVNPNFLRPFVYGRSTGRRENEIHENIVVQANYDLDFAKQTNRLGWLGFHRLTGLYSKTKVDQLTYQIQDQFDSVIPGVWETSNDAVSRHAYQVWYVGDAVQPGDTHVRFTGLPTTTIATLNRSVGYTYLNNAGAWVQSPTPVSVARKVVANNRNNFLRENSGVGLSLQSYFWKRRIVTLFGARQDEVEALTRTRLPDPAGRFLGDSRADYDNLTVPQLNNKKDTLTQSIVYHAADWLRVFANRSENFAATAPRTDNFYRPLAPQNGETNELGLGIKLLDNKLDVRATYYKSSQKDATSGAAASTARLRVAAVEGRLYNALDSAGRLAEWTTFGPNGATTDRYEVPTDVSATEDRVSTGYEVEIIYNPTRSWRISASFNTTDSISTNVGRELGEFLAARAPFYKKYFDAGLRQDGTYGVPYNHAADNNLVSRDFQSTVASEYVAARNREGTGSRGVPDYTATFVTSYNLREGFLKGLGFGANVRWENGKIFGYPQVPSIYTVGGLENVPGTVADLQHPYISGNIYSGGVFLKYGRRILSGRVNWRTQLNAQNLFNENGVRVIGTQPDGTAVYGVSRPLTFQLSNTFEF